MSRKTRKHRNSHHKRRRRRRKKTRGRRRPKRKSGHRRRRRHSFHKGMRGGVRKLGFSPFPPGGPYKPNSTTNGLDGGYYYAKNNNVVEPPANISASSVGGRRRRRSQRRRRQRKRKSRRTRGQKRHAARRRRGRRRSRKGGGRLSRLLPTAIESLPLGTDIRDGYWKAGSALTNTWNTWNGQPNNMSPNPAVQPIGSQGLIGFSPQPDMADMIHNTSMQAAKYT